MGSGELFHPGVKPLSGVTSLVDFFFFPQMLVIDMLHKVFIRSESFLVVFWISGIESYHLQIGYMTSSCPFVFLLFVSFVFYVHGWFA